MTGSSTDIQESAYDARGAANFSFRHRLLRLVWNVTWACLASWTLPQMGAWRRFLLTAFGASIHPTASVRGGAKIWYPPNLEMKPYSVLADGVECYNMAPIVIGENSIVSQRSFLCAGTHDFSQASHPLIVRPITIGKDVWIAAEAFVGPGVEVPEGCVIGARAVVNGQLTPWGVYAGNPAKRIKERSFDQNA